MSFSLASLLPWGMQPNAGLSPRCVGSLIMGSRLVRSSFGSFEWRSLVLAPRLWLQHHPALSRSGNIWAQPQSAAALPTRVWKSPSHPNRLRPLRCCRLQSRRQRERTCPSSLTAQTKIRAPLEFLLRERRTPVAVVDGRQSLRRRFLNSSGCSNPHPGEK